MSTLFLRIIYAQFWIFSASIHRGVSTHATGQKIRFLSNAFQKAMATRYPSSSICFIDGTQPYPRRTNNGWQQSLETCQSSKMFPKLLIRISWPCCIKRNPVGTLKSSKIYLWEWIGTTMARIMKVFSMIFLSPQLKKLQGHLGQEEFQMCCGLLRYLEFCSHENGM